VLLVLYSVAVVCVVNFFFACVLCLLYMLKYTVFTRESRMLRAS